MGKCPSQPFLNFQDPHLDLQLSRVPSRDGRMGISMTYSLCQRQGKDEQHGWLVGDPEFKSLQNPSDHHHALAGGKVYVLQCHQLFISSWPASTLVFPQVAQARNMSIGEHRLALLRNFRNIRICMGKKNYRFCNLRKWKDFNKKILTLLKMCVTSLLCGQWADLWPVYGFLCKQYILSIWRFTKVGHSSQAARLIHWMKKAVNSLQLLQLPPNSA